MADPIASATWDRYRYCVNRGHREYTHRALLNERMYLGGGRQWPEAEAASLKAQKREPYEFNEIFPSVNSALGHQIHNRLDIQFRPRGGRSDQTQAEIRSKIVMQIADRNHLHAKETEVFGDGIIQQRGYFDVRVNFDKNMQGDIAIEVLDPMDVIPDPDAKTYEPSGWADVCVTRWLTMDDIEASFGKEARAKVEASNPNEPDHGEYDDTGAPRAKFADNALSGGYDAYYTDGAIKRVRAVERQSWVRSMSRMLFYPRTGDLKLAENLTPEVIQQQIRQGAQMTRSIARRVKWVACTQDVLLHDQWSPYDDFSIIPFFAYFRRGQTLGLVDNAIGPQRAHNKAMAQFVHIVNTTANSGWTVEENSLTNMTTRELEGKGAMTGLILEYRKGSNAPEKIDPNKVPSGVDRLIELTRNALKSVTVPDAMRGIDGVDTSGIARQTQQAAAQQQLAVPVDNLARTRLMMGEKLSALTRQFYTEERTFRITEIDFQTGKPIETPITINQFDPATGTFNNDMTEGDYDVVVSEQPIAATFEEGQFQQSMEMRKVGVALPDTVVVQSSSLARKSEIVEQMQAAQGQADPLTQAKVALTEAQTVKTRADAVNAGVTGMFSATQAANQIAAVPAVAPLADALLQSAGFVDQDAAPIVPMPPEGLAPPGDVAAMPDQPQANTSPNFPAVPGQPDIGVNAGIETADPAAGVPA
jgi:hypothetical protein